MPVRICFTLVVLLLVFSTGQAHTPHDAVPASAMSPAFETDQTLFCSVTFMQNFLLKSTDGGETWSTSQKGISASPVTSLAFSPDYAADETVFAGTKGGELFKTTDGGASWQLCNESVLASKIRCIALSPSFATDGIVCYGTEEHGVLGSADRGATWFSANQGLQTRYIFRLVFSPDFDVDQTLFVGTGGGLYKSVDKGLNWFKPAPHAGFFVTSISLSPDYGQDQTLYAATWGYGVHASIDGGVTWQSRNAGLPELEVASVALSPDFANDGTVLAGTREAGLFKSTDEGSSWIMINEGLDEQTDQTTVHYFDFLFSPRFAVDRKVLLVSFEGLYKSEDDVTRWRHLNIFNQNMIRSLVCSPEYATDGTVFAGAYGGGVYRTRDSGDSWKAVNTGCFNVYADPMAISPAYGTDGTAFAGYYRSVHKTTTGGDSWQFIEVDPANYIYIRYMAISSGFAADRTLFVGNAVVGEIPIYKSIDGGLSYNPIAVPYPVFSLALSPEYPSDQTLFAGSRYGVFRSLNGGGTFSLVSPWLLINDLAVSDFYASDGTVFAGASGHGVLRSTDHGTSWDTVNTGLDGAVIEAIGISPDFAADGTVFATTKSRGVFKSIDGGDIWSYSGLDGEFVHRIAVSPAFATDRTVYVGTWDGVVRTTDGGASWERVLKVRHYDQECKFIYYYGNWARQSDSFATGGSVALSDETDAEARLFFSGTSIKWIGVKTETGGIADVYIDDAFQGQVDLYSPQPEWQADLFSVTGLAPGAHSIRIVATGTQNPSSLGAFVFIDALESEY